MAGFVTRTVNGKPPTIPFGIVAYSFSENLSRNSRKRVKLTAKKPWTKILPVVNVGSPEKRSNQPKYKEPRTRSPALQSSLNFSLLVVNVLYFDAGTFFLLCEKLRKCSKR